MGQYRFLPNITETTNLETTPFLGIDVPIQELANRRSRARNQGSMLGGQASSTTSEEETGGRWGR